jgi:hypothetical protein
MNATMPTERMIATMLAEEGLARAPERVLETALERVDGMPQRRSSWTRLRARWAIMPDRRRLLIVALATLLVVGVAAAGAVLVRPIVPPIDPSTLILVQRVHDPSERSQAIDIYAVDQIGAVRVLTTVGPNVSRGQVGDGTTTLSIDGYLALPNEDDVGLLPPSIIDLRDPSAPVLRPDSPAYGSRFGPDARVAMRFDDSRLAIFDPQHGTTAWPNIPSGLDLDFGGQGLTWTTTGGLLAQTGQVSNDVLETRTIDDEGHVVDGPAIGYYAGVGPRRVDGTGRWLRCAIENVYDCPSEGAKLHALSPLGSPVVWATGDRSIRLADYAWAADGGLWLLIETTAPGPRTVTVQRVGADGRVTTITTLEGPADDPSPEAYFPAATFAGFARDDSRILIQTQGEVLSTRLWWLTPRTGRMTRLPDATVAGWIDPTTLSTPRIAPERVPETPEAIHGAWTDGFVSFEITRTGFTLRTGTWQRPTVPIRSTGVDAIMLENLSMIPGCGAGDATYRWSTVGSSLTLTPVDEPCAERTGLLARTFDRALLRPNGLGVAALDPGLTYRTTTFPQAFRITSPRDGSAGVQTVDREQVDLGRHDGSAQVHIFVPSRGMDDPCVRRNTTVPISAGIKGVMDYLTSRQALLITPYKPVRIGKTDVSSIWIDPMQKCPMELFVTGDGSGFTSIPTRLALDERPDGTAVAFVIYADSAADERWVDELLGSLEWLP